jgi:CDP-glucose 4,6-dehydratase
VALNPQAWRGRRVLLTGHSGFKGGWLALWLRELGAEVRGYSLAPPDGPTLWQAARLDEVVAGEFADIREAGQLAAAVRGFAPEVVLHLAAQPLVRESYRNPADTYATNVMGTVSLLEAVRQAPSVRAVLVVTTDKCYENREWLWPYRENDPLGGHDPYSASKACAELVCASYRRAFLEEAGVGLASARAGNVIGGGDFSTDRLLPDVFRAWGADEEVVLRYPQATRPWQHVLEPLAGYLQLTQGLLENSQEFGGAWNLGPGPDSVVSVQNVVSSLAGLWPEPSRWRVESAGQVHEAGMLALDSSQARKRLGWRPRWSLEQALAHTVDWQRAWQAGQDMRAFTLQQIERYSSEAL